MIRRVEFTRRVEKQARKLPGRVLRKLKTWTYLVEEIGLEEVRKTPGYHDEPLVGRRRGTRSIRLSGAYRAFYRLVQENGDVSVSVEEVSKHGY
jgi:proteic killer suppression protein